MSSDSNGTNHISKKPTKRLAKPIIDDTNRDYQFTDSDIEVVSSDDKRFKVHTWVLMAGSVVFRDMLQVGKSAREAGEVVFTDPKIETSTILQLFFGVCYKSVIADPAHTGKTGRYEDLIALAQKYEAETVIGTIKTSLYKWIGFGLICPFNSLVLAARLDDIQIATAAISKAEDWMYVDVQKETEKDLLDLRGILGCNAIDLTSISFKDFALLPDEYKFALLRASRPSGGLYAGKVDWTEIAKSFYIVMTKIRASPKSKVS
ncbi:uncharacterized protein IL334_007717 [Kwoniella shivajii]|uniref:BTB domain-containing protein n=1 Tax=Kwoniella shivajii TaxID=564305 RepID=A0ABZ1D9G0_9TREE|nr:hypothetical protein IL334_007717 [Kwoniella shivajii]